MNSDDGVLSFADERARASEWAGGKASRLAELTAAGFPVPEGFVVTTRAFDRFLRAQGDAFEPSHETINGSPIPNALGAAIREALVPFGDSPMAVRSSAVAEDLAGASFAGQYETVLDVRGADAVIDAIRVCWASAFAPRVLAYRSKHGRSDPPRMAVLVQRLVAADAAGVAFSANPVTGRRDEVVINAVKGLGEAVVSGEATADEWRVTAEGEAEEVATSRRAIGSDEARAIAELARRVQSHDGAPQDIEWAIARGVLYLLQARPITALPDEVEWHAPAPGLWLRTFRLGEWLGDPITPLFETWLLDRIEQRLFARFEEISGAPVPAPYHVTVHGWYYTTANFMPRSVPHAMGLAFRYLLPAVIRDPKRMSVLTTAWAHHGMALFEGEWRAGAAARYEEGVSEAKTRVEKATADELVRRIDEMADLAGDEVFYFFTVGGSAWKPESQLATFCRKHLAPTIAVDQQDLLQGLGSTSPADDHLVLGLDWFHPTLGELGVRRDLDAESRRRSDASQRREHAESRAREALAAHPSLRSRFDTLLARAQHYGRVREEQVAHLTLAWPVLRRAVHRLGEMLVERGRLRSPDDAYFLMRDELLAALESDSTLDLTDRASERRASWERQRRLAPPVMLGTMGTIQRRIFQNVEAAFGAAPATSDHSVRGLPASPGRATGRVRIIRSPEEFANFRPDEILVAPATNPGWTPLFAHAAAVVTDTGSVMAHASLVAREYAIPAVVGTGDATSRLRDGQLVTVDGSAGTVEIARED